jgi:hypothetical protein
LAAQGFGLRQAPLTVQGRGLFKQQTRIHGHGP